MRAAQAHHRSSDEGHSYIFVIRMTVTEPLQNRYITVTLARLSRMTLQHITNLPTVIWRIWQPLSDESHGAATAVPLV